MSIGERIKLVRKGKYTQAELAELLGVHETTIRRWESGRDDGPKERMLSKLASALNTTVAYLSGETDAPDRPVPMERQAEPEPVKLETQTRDRGELFFRFPDGGELRLPDTPENKALFEKMVAQRLGAGKEQS